MQETPKIRQIGVYRGVYAILCSATKNGEENAPRTSPLEPLCALFVLSQQKVGNIVSLKGCAKDNYHVLGSAGQKLPVKYTVFDYLFLPQSLQNFGFLIYLF